ncbi:3-hydroxyacyl-ACP dehydratase FabZ [Marinivivus vitaminiproducens]|uniref:3-hydroxyacyl-ACP dehydratase FabZ n=1 Tax=Marinivivus vitaminiproducens TaxID=3035935 RepID=UPI0027A53C2C|nr:3-hydroxyacyl-ACP dehydratase FabZ [Geminicoccaceae bacterium SCSIO 64248]
MTDTDRAIAPGTALPDLDVEAIQRLIPHRFPFLLIDRVVELVAHESAVGIKNVTVNEPYFTGHFPQRPVMPGVLQIEAMAQTAAALVAASLALQDQNMLVYFMSIDGAKFRRPVVPGDVLRLSVRKTATRLGVWKFEGEATVEGKAAASASFSAKIAS